MLLFRSRLWSNASDRWLYERTRRELARQEWKYTQNYAAAKTAEVEEIIAWEAAQDSPTLEVKGIETP